MRYRLRIDLRHRPHGICRPACGRFGRPPLFVQARVRADGQPARARSQRNDGQLRPYRCPQPGRHSIFYPDHPLLRNSLDSLLSSEKGNAVLSVYQGTEARGIFLQVTYLVECVAPRDLHIDRYLAISPTTLWLDHSGRSYRLPSSPQNISITLRTPMIFIGNAGIKRLVKKMRKSAEAHMFQVTEDLVAEARVSVEQELQSEISRLQNLARLNPSVDQQEIKNLQIHQASIEEALAESRFRLDSLHLVVVEN